MFLFNQDKLYKNLYFVYVYFTLITTKNEKIEYN